MNVLNITNKNEFGIPRVRLFNTIFHLRKINTKLMLTRCGHRGSKGPHANFTAKFF